MSKAEKLLAKGRTLEGKGKREKALNIYRSGCRSFPFDPDLWSARGELAKDLGNTEEAVEALFKTCELYARGGLPAEALEVVDRVLALDSKHGAARRLKRTLEERLSPLEPEPPRQAEPQRKSAPHPAAKEPAPETAATEAAEPTKELAGEPAPAAEAAPEPPEAPSEAPAPPEPPAEEVVAAPAPEVEGAPETEAEAAPAPETEAEAAPAPEPKPEPTPPPKPEPESVVIHQPRRSRASRTKPPPRPPEPASAYEIIPVEPSRPTVVSSSRMESEVGMDTRDSALDNISLADRLPSSGSSANGTDILLEEDGKLDVIQAVASTLTSSPLLSELDSDLVRTLIDCGKLVHRGTEEVLFRQGDVGSSLFLILSGEISVRWEGRPPASEKRELARLRPGAFFGEMALLTNAGRSASVVATRPSDFLEISRKSVRVLVDRDPRILKLIMRFFRARLVGTLLQTSPVFTPFSRDERRRLVSRFRLRELKPDQTVIAEGEGTEGLFLVLAGKLEVLQALKTSQKKKSSSPEGLSVLLGTLSMGDIFGEMSLLDASVATATVRTRTRTWVLLLPRDEYDGIVENHPQIKEHLAAVAAERRARNKEALSGNSAEIRESRLDPV